MRIASFEACLNFIFFSLECVEPHPGEGESLRSPLSGELDRLKSDDVGCGMLF